MKDDIARAVKAKTDELVALRRHLHKMPEVAFKEFGTSELIAEKMNALGLPTQTGIGKTGVVAILEGSQPGPTLMIRADIDGLPVSEDTGLDFASTNGAMHACGHDGHTAMLITAAEILSTMKESLHGKVMFLFQPAEETVSGAKAMIADGVLEEYKPDRAIGIHNWGILPIGQIAVNKGPLMAGGSMFKITIKGVPGHGAQPDRSVDTVVIGSQIVLALQNIVSREIAPLTPAVITIGRIESSSKTGNVIGSETVLEGTSRALDPEVIDAMWEAIRRVAIGIGTTGRADVTVERLQEIRPTINDSEVAEWWGGIARSMVGDGAIQYEPRMGGEDMSEFMHRVPGAYFLVGSHKDGGGAAHSPTFDFDEACLPIGVELFVRAAVDYLS